MSGDNLVKLGHLARFGNGQDWKKVAADDGEFPVYGSGGQFGWASEFLHDGEAILFGRKGTVDHPIYVDGKFWTVDTMYYAVPNTDRCRGKYLYYWATTIPFKTIATNTALPSVTSMDLSQLYVPLPPLETQQRIADYLDRETAEIDAAVADLDRYVKLLGKRRQATITLAVEGKIGPGATCHAFRQIKLGYVAPRIRTGLNPRKNFELDTTDAENWYITVRELAGYDLRITEKTNRINDKALELIQRRSDVKVGDILFSGTGTIGNTAIVSKPPSNWGVKEGIYILTPVTKWIDSKFLLWLLKSDTVISSADEMSQGSTIKSISIDKLKRVPFGLPPLDTQYEIARYLDQETTEIDLLIAESTKLRDLLLKRRSVLINEVVTGRKQV